MDKTTTLQEAAAFLRSEAAECLRLASDIEKRIEKSTNGSEQLPAAKQGRLVLKSRKKKSLLVHAIDVLRERGPTHVKEVVAEVAMRAGRHVSRASVEAALIRGMDTKGITRPSRGTYAMQ